jgi:hypothetical protein
MDEREKESPQEFSSLRQINEQRLKYLHGLIDESSVPPEEAPVNPLHTQVSVQQARTPNNVAPKKFSTSWLNMQNFLAEKHRDRDLNNKHR